MVPCCDWQVFFLFLKGFEDFPNPKAITDGPFKSTPLSCQIYSQLMKDDAACNAHWGFELICVYMLKLLQK